MADPMLAIQTWIYSTLDSALSCEVYDSVPQEAAKPYVVIESYVAIEADSQSTRRDDVLVYLSVWSTVAGQHEILTLMGQIDDALHDKRPTLSSGRAVIVRVRNKRTARDIDGRTFQGQVVVRCTVEH
jgi:hypothetical protein